MTENGAGVKKHRSDLVGVSELAEWLDVPASWIYRRTSAGHPDPLPALKIGKLLRFRVADIEEYLEQHRNRDAEWTPKWA